MFYGSDKKFSYTACQRIEAEAEETGKHIYHKMCGHGGERIVKVWVLDDKGKKTLASFSSGKWSDPGDFLKSQGKFFCHFYVPFFTYF